MLGDDTFSTGDVYVTRHSNLGNVHVGLKF